MCPRNTLFTKEEIIDAAFEMVRQHGWQGFSVQAVAKAIGSSTMPIYSHFQNACELEDAVVWKALQLLKQRMLKIRTGDKWIDHAINWVKFAQEEKHLHRIIWDGRNVAHCIKCGEEINRFIAAELTDYGLFADLTPEEAEMITLARRCFIQKLALWLNKDPDYLKNKGLDTEDFIRRTSKALYDGFKLQFSSAKQS